MVYEATMEWLKTYPVPHATAQNTILGLEKQILWRHGTPERIESDNGTHFKNSLINTWAREHGIEWVYHIPYHTPAAGKVEKHNELLKTQGQVLSFRGFLLQRLYTNLHKGTADTKIKSKALKKGKEHFIKTGKSADPAGLLDLWCKEVPAIEDQSCPP
ncbi:hypothetical protein DUI87_26426 [Hirundo rustica rustica]|uniref:Integrase catalytic domain-containing protein n=1 Tax=Hirundo rustica rustica TaxID=333673 RepID=A0A3M0J8E2_HIRRU|nr:hypothetical protein DUI87_26426 [Hirundo rustica rustica]